MAKELKIYRCALCGNIVVLLHEGPGELVCCEQPMKLLVAGENDTAAKEKHVPVVSVDGNLVVVNVGSVDHPMINEHYIEFVILVSGAKCYIEYLNPGQAPKATFMVEDTSNIEVYEYCNLHGLWKA
ncbi:MAG: desulfoferrodoxin [Clostridiaceae bacterium]|nr:desulfoferrodoxin [Clostridiaceae bacterium]